eukprot:TRINITY_DN107445_c0_g1_i1.p1 TRINITY_DN107445_c0_g1~~TRINITY_DN107445_c0_g1_i1.p1  ORF type:complete len:888 (-),score=214.55 TRINITY_DN107445_c0_g1_i1:112-2775(-)
MAIAAEGMDAVVSDELRAARQRLQQELQDASEMDGRLQKVRAGLNASRQQLQSELRETSAISAQLEQAKLQRRRAEEERAQVLADVKELRRQLAELHEEKEQLRIAVALEKEDNSREMPISVQPSSTEHAQQAEDRPCDDGASLDEEEPPSETQEERLARCHELTAQAEVLLRRHGAASADSTEKITEATGAVQTLEEAREAGDLASELGELVGQLEGQLCQEQDELCCALLQVSLIGLERHLDPKDPEVLTAMNALAVSLENLGDRQAALKLYRRALEGRQKSLGEQHPHSLDSGYNLAVCLAQEGEKDEAEVLFRRVLEGCRTALGTSHPGTLDCCEQLSLLLEERAELTSAWRLRRQLLEGCREEFGEDSPEALSAMSQLASVLATAAVAGAASPAAASDALHASAVRHQQVLGIGHPQTLDAMHKHASFLAGRGGDAAAAEAVLRSVLESCMQKLGSTAPPTLVSMDQLAIHLETRRRWVEAETLFRRALASREALLGALHEETLASSYNLAVFLAGMPRRAAEAEQQLRHVISGRQATLGRLHEETLESCRRLCDFLAASGRRVEAEALLWKLLEEIEASVKEAQMSEEDPRILNCQQDLAGLLCASGKYSEGETIYRKVWAAQQRASGGQMLERADTEFNLGVCLSNQRKYADAEAFHRSAIEIYTLWYSACDPCTLGAVSNLACCLEEQGRSQEAEPLHRRVLAGFRAAFGGSHASVLHAEELLAMHQKRRQQASGGAAAAGEGAAPPDEGAGSPAPTTPRARTSTEEEHTPTAGQRGKQPNSGRQPRKLGFREEASSSRAAAVPGSPASSPKGRAWAAASLSSPSRPNFRRPWRPAEACMPVRPSTLQGSAQHRHHHHPRGLHTRQLPQKAQEAQKSST